MSTQLGKYLRTLRIERQERLLDMANRLGVSSAFLSAVENGKKRMPEAWYSKLENLYQLTPDQLVDLKQANLESQDEIVLNLTQATEPNRKLAISFARQFDSMDQETAERIMKMLKG